MRTGTSVEIIRDPLWNNIRVDRPYLALIDSVPFQRLRYVRQLGHAFLVYPGATHTRFEHALGTYHLARRAIGILDERGDLDAIGDEECGIVRAAALLHDIGHYPFSHALEEIGAASHESVAKPMITTGPVADVLHAHWGADAPARVHALITGESTSPLQRLISGSLDLDKLDYLRRDAFMCGVAYGEIDVDRLLNSLAVVEDPDTGQPTVGILEKGLSALESLLFARYQMYRNVYWHHAVRSATVMYKRLVSTALQAGTLDVSTLAGFTDEGLMEALSSPHLSPRRTLGPMFDATENLDPRRRGDDEGRGGLPSALRERRLYKRAFERSSAELPHGAAEWISDDYALTAQVEDALARELGCAPGDVLLDYPIKTQMLGLDIPVLRRGGEVRRLTTTGWPGAMNLPRLADELYQSARWLRVFSRTRTAIPADRIAALAALPAALVRARIDGGDRLL